MWFGIQLFTGHAITTMTTGTGTRSTPPGFEQAPRGRALERALRAGRIPGFDFLRVLAVVTVMMGHAGLTVVGIGLQTLLVFSGFLITWMMLKEEARHGHIDVLRFYRRRATRLLPALYAYIVIGTLYLMWRGIEVPWHVVTAASLYYINYLQAFTGAPAHYLSHIWSLALQEQFYLLWPLVLLLARRHRVPLAPVILALIGSVWLYRAVACLVFGASDEYLYRALETRGDNLAMGGLLAVLMHKRRWVALFDRLKPHAFWILLAIVAYLQVSVHYRNYSLEYKYVVSLALDPLLIALAIPFILQAAAGDTWLARLMRSRFIIATGKGSYAMYLMHSILMHPIINVLKRHGVAPWMGFIVAVPVVALVGHLAFRYYETPVRNWLEARLAGRSRLAMA